MAGLHDIAKLLRATLHFSSKDYKDGIYDITRPDMLGTEELTVVGDEAVYEKNERGDISEAELNADHPQIYRLREGIYQAETQRREERMLIVTETVQFYDTIYLSSSEQ